MDKEELARLKELAQKATPGPWRLYSDNDTLVMGADGRLITSSNHCMFKIRLSLLDNAKPDDNAAYIAAISPDVLLALIKEIEQLRHEKDVYTRAMADYLQVAKMAWGGEISSPLPGHTSSEEKMIEQFEYLNCPCCGGSGHVGDCNMALQNLKCDLANAQLMADNLEKEANWLAKQLKVKDNCVSHGGFLLDNRTLSEWREAAREAVKDETNA